MPWSGVGLEAGALAGGVVGAHYLGLGHHAVLLLREGIAVCREREKNNKTSLIYFQFCHKSFRKGGIHYRTVISIWSLSICAPGQLMSKYWESIWKCAASGLETLNIVAISLFPLCLPDFQMTPWISPSANKQMRRIRLSRENRAQKTVFLLLVYVLAEYSLIVKLNRLCWISCEEQEKDWNISLSSIHSLLNQLFRFTLVSVFKMLQYVCLDRALTWHSLLHRVWASYAWRCFPKDSCQQMGPFV